MKRAPWKTFVASVGTLLLAGCVNVRVYERSHLAAPEMRFDAELSVTKLSQQMYAAKEASSGGYTTGGGGCGCN